MSVRGWVYVIVNKAMPGLVKVGFSTKDPILRACELGNTGIPHPYEVMYDALVDSPREIEQSVHRALQKEREGREWFRCSLETAIQAIRRSTTVLHLERHSGQIEDGQLAEENSLSSSKCWYSNCIDPVTRNYRSRFFCARHYEVERKSRFYMVRQETRKA